MPRTIARAERVAVAAITQQEEMQAAMRAGLGDLRHELAPRPREMLAAAIKRHGGPSSVLEQAGYERGKPVEGVAWKSARRVLERYQTEKGTEKRAETGVAPKYAAILERVIGAEEMQRIQDAFAGRGKEPKLPPTGEITIEITGEIAGYEGSDDVRYRTVAGIIPAKWFARLERNPMSVWRAWSNFKPHVQQMVEVSLVYDSQAQGWSGRTAGGLGRRGPR